ncbi:Endoplasmic reticulum vesicle transporter protein [Citrus sinensis]|uniref:Endoplasmic reticulum vesicle transporter protein n=1 Tax=Citrus sinensis TaxID=2711 RepID=A0ACB8KQQ6_CITSI|nr:Endoplasmic reticulum vesicle transporter protein [Citrus sinensis]
MDAIMNKIRSLDAYPKINEDFYSRTFSGGVITLVSSIVMLLLFFSELRLYLNAVTETKLLVDTSRGETLRINFDVTFPALPCSILSVDAMDISGEQHLDVKHDIFKKRLDSQGNVIESRQDGIGAPKVSGMILLERKLSSEDINWGKHLKLHVEVSSWREREAYVVGNGISNNDKGYTTRWSISYRVSNMVQSCIREISVIRVRVCESDYRERMLRRNSDSGSSDFGSATRIIDKPLQRHGGRLEHNETYCGSCYGAESSDEDCCNNCEEVREAYRKKGWALSNPDLIDQCKREGFLQRIKEEEGEGCNIYGFLEVNKVAGNFHFAPGKSFHQSGVHVHDILAFQRDSFNISHKINKLAFGEHFPGVVNPLDGVRWTQETPSGMYQYFIKVVPTVYTDVSGHTIQSNQFSVTEHFRSSEQGRLQTLPGVFFFYDLSPIKVTFTEEHVSFLHFLTNVCAIVGVNDPTFKLDVLSSFSFPIDEIAKL